MAPKSDIWLRFTIKTNDETKAVCLHCSKEVGRCDKTSHDFNTTNLRTHMGSDQPDKKLKLYDLKTFSEMFASWNRSAPQSIETDRALAKMICTDMQPASIVEDEAAYNMGEQLPELAKTVTIKLKDILKTADELAVTTNLWTSGADFIIMPFCGSSHTGELIAEKYFYGIFEWEIAGKVKVIISVSAASMKSAIAQLPNVSRIPCVQHRLQLVVKEGCLNQSSVLNLWQMLNALSHFHMSGLHQVIERSSSKVWITTTCSNERRSDKMGFMLLHAGEIG
ncbi:hypothetical protein PR048_009001 [Dryococelus australis]|uniref:BED-type domain-containing protein n=1 Tax=Dryococelus australis TaxID=614101 RepID=A0ABQ9HYN4_9NEOP|nr:hypothetical protein PR048_009001 [Dryococelus australis]